MGHHGRRGHGGFGGHDGGHRGFGRGHHGGGGYGGHGRGHDGYDRHDDYDRHDGYDRGGYGYGRRRSGGLLGMILSRLLGRRRHH